MIATSRQDLRRFRKRGNLEGDGVCCLGDLAGAHGQLERATRLAGAAEALDETWRSQAARVRREAHDRDMAAVRAALGEETFAAAWRAGQTMTLDQAEAEAVAAI